MISKRKKVLIIFGGLIFLLLATLLGWKIYQSKLKADIVRKNQSDNNLSKYYSNGRGFVPGEVIVKYKKEINQSKINQTNDNIKKRKYLKNKINVSEINQVSDKRYKIKFNISKIISNNSVKQLNKSNNILEKKLQKNNINTKQLLQQKQRGKLTLKDLYAFKLTNKLSSELKQDQSIETISLNYIYKASDYLPNDTYISKNRSKNRSTWTKGAFGQNYEDLWGLKQNNVVKAWQKSTGKRNNSGGC